MKSLRYFCSILSAAAAISTARATTVIPPTFDELVSDAQLIFQGTVTRVESQWMGEGAERCIVSYVTLQVEDALKGNPGTTYTLRMLGGTVGIETMAVSDAPRFKAGDRDILFVENNGSQFIPLVGIMHGRFRVQHEATGGREVVARNSGELLSDLAQIGSGEPFSRVSHDAGAVPATKSGAATPLGLSEFKSAIRAKLNGGSASTQSP